jgi:hypothetical protein
MKIFSPDDELWFELERMKSRVRDLMYITAGLFEAPPMHFGVDVEDYLIGAMDNIRNDRPLMHNMNDQPKRLLPPIDQETPDARRT